MSVEFLKPPKERGKHDAGIKHKSKGVSSKYLLTPGKTTLCIRILDKYTFP